MNYFVTNDERIGTCYHEFFKGKWDGETFWKEDSLCLDDDLLCECRAFGNAILSVIPSYSPFGITEISPEQWEAINRLRRMETTSVWKCIGKPMRGCRTYFQHTIALRF